MIKRAWNGIKLDWTIPIPTMFFGLLTVVGLYYKLSSDVRDIETRLRYVEQLASSTAQCQTANATSIAEIKKDVSWLRSLIEKRSDLRGPFNNPFDPTPMTAQRPHNEG